MFKKSSLTLAATFIATLAIQNTAFASDTNTNVRDHRITVNSNVRDHRTKRKNEVVIVERKDCQVGYDKLRSRGFEDIMMQTCTGMKFRYFAKKNASYFSAYMHAYSGSMEIHRLGVIGPH